MSSFKKHIKVLPKDKDIVDSSNTSVISVTNNLTSAVSLLGVKPWINYGLGLVSTGNKQFDEFIGGGLSLGTLTLFDLDHISNYGDTLISYNIAESLSIGHETLLICFLKSSFEKYKKSLPYNQHFKSSKTTLSSTNTILNPKEFQHTNDSNIDVFSDTTIEQDGAMGESITNKASDSLKLAASYKKYIDEKEKKVKQSQSVIVPPTAINNSNNIILVTSSSSSSCGGKASVTNYCSSYDLSRSLQLEVFENNPLHIFIGESLYNSSSSNNNNNNSNNNNNNNNIDNNSNYCNGNNNGNLHNDSNSGGEGNNDKSFNEDSINGNHNDNHSLSLSQVLDSYLQTIQAFIQSTIHERKTVGRIFIPDLNDLLMTLLSPVISYGYNSGFNNGYNNNNNNNNDNRSNSSNNCNNNNGQNNNASLLLKFLVQIKQMIRNYRIAVIFSLQPISLSSSSLSASRLHQQISDVADNYFSLDSFISHHTFTATTSTADAVPYEFREFQGFFCIHKLSCLGTLSAYRPAGSNYRYGLKRDRRKLNIEPLHLPPEDNRATASSVASDVKQMNQLQSQQVQSQIQQSQQQSHSHDHTHSHSQQQHLQQQTQHKTSGILAYVQDDYTTMSSDTNKNSYSSSNINTTSPTANSGTSTTTPATATTSADQATRVSLLAAKFAKSAANVTKGSSISISKVNLTSNNITSGSTVKTAAKSSGSSHSLFSPSSGLLSNDAEKSLDF